MGVVLSTLASIFRRREPRTPIKGLMPRVINVLRNNYRGIFGTIFTVAAIAAQFNYRNNTSVQIMWIIMGCLFLFQPVNIPVVGMVPIFMLPMLGVMDSASTCACYMNETMLLFLLSGMAVLLWNNSGLDRRVALWFLNYKAKPETYSKNQLILRTGTASFVLSIFSSKLIVTSLLTEYITKPLMDLQYATSRGGDPNYDKVRGVVCNTIQTCSCIGSIVFPHSSIAMLAARMIYYESSSPGLTYPDIFNYFQFVCYSLPVAIIMLLFNMIYNMLLLLKEPAMSAWGMKTLRAAMLKNKDGMPKKITTHEILTLVAKILLLAALFSRWSSFFQKYYMGWSDYMREPGDGHLTGINDTTVFAVFVILLHILPKGFGFVRFFRFSKIKKKSQLGPIKPESAILYWRFVDKNVNYGYIFLLGSGVALVVSARVSTLGEGIAAEINQHIQDLDWNIYIGIICVIAVVLANIMTSVAACVLFLPYVLMVSLPPDATIFLAKRTYLQMLAVGAGTTFGFCWPYLYTPAYFCHHTGKVPLKRMAKYGAGSAVICMVILWGSLVQFAPLLWDPSGEGIGEVVAPLGIGVVPITEPTTLLVVDVPEAPTPGSEGGADAPAEPAK